MRRDGHKHGARGFLAVGAALGLALVPLTTFAQAEAPAAPAPAAEVPAAPPAPEVPAAPAPVVADTAPMVTATAAPPPPAVMDDSAKPLSVGVWGRIGNIVQDKKDPKKLGDISQNAEVDLLLSGQIHQYVKWQADFVATYGSGGAGTAAVLDLIGKLELHDAFNLWVGRMLVPSDRSNFSGPWFMAPWNYPGLAGPRQGPFGRNDGATLWGQFGGGTFKYYASAFDLGDGAQSPLYSARFNIALINPEPGFYHSSTYYGGKDLLAIGLSGQYKKDGSMGAAVPVPMMPGMTTPGPVDDFSGFSADVLFEKNLGGAGVLDLEGAFYAFQGDYEGTEMAFWGLASYLLPGTIGIGKVQPLVRFQSASPKSGDATNVLDAQVGYVIADYAARLAVGYQNTSGAAKGNAIFLGFQLQK